MFSELLMDKQTATPRDPTPSSSSKQSGICEGGGVLVPPPSGISVTPAMSNGAVSSLQYPLDPLSFEYCRTLRSSAELMVRIINDVLDVSKMLAGKLTVEHIPVELSHLLIDVWRSHQVAAAAKQIFFQVELQEVVPSIVLGDLTRIRQILSNFVSNAIKFTSKGLSS